MASAWIHNSWMLPAACSLAWTNLDGLQGHALRAPLPGHIGTGPRIHESKARLLYNGAVPRVGRQGHALGRNTAAGRGRGEAGSRKQETDGGGLQQQGKQAVVT